MIDHVPARRAHWIWRCHIDLSTPNEDVLGFLLPSIARYDAADLPPARVRAATPPACRRRTSGRPRSTRWRRRTWRSRPRTRAYIVDQFGIDVERPLLTQVSRFDPWKDPLGVIDAYRLVKERHPGGAARARRLDGARRPGGLGLLQPDRRARGRRPGHLHPLEPQQRRRRRGQRVPGALGRGHPEVDPRGVRPDRDRGALEGSADRRRPRRRDRRPDRGRRDRLARRLVDASAPRPASRSSPTPTRRASGRCAARSTCAGTS